MIKPARNEPNNIYLNVYYKIAKRASKIILKEERKSSRTPSIWSRHLSSRSKLTIIPSHVSRSSKHKAMNWKNRHRDIKSSDSPPNRCYNACCTLPRQSRPGFYHAAPGLSLFHRHTLIWPDDTAPVERKFRINQLGVESNSRLLWLYFTALCDWLTKSAPFRQPMTNKPKTIRGLFAGVFPPFAHVTYVFALNSDWFIALFASAVIEHAPLNLFQCFPRVRKQESLFMIV